MWSNAKMHKITICGVTYTSNVTHQSGIFEQHESEEINYLAILPNYLLK